MSVYADMDMCVYANVNADAYVYVDVYVDMDMWIRRLVRGC